jgi:negative regulator of sigma E activity
MPEPAARRRVRAVNQVEGKTHDEIYQLIEESSLKSDQAVQASAEIKELLEKLNLAIGSEGEDEYGKPIGTGIVGRLMRLERDVQRRFATLDGWTRTATGVAMAAAVLGGVLWWLVRERLAELLK